MNFTGNRLRGGMAGGKQYEYNAVIHDLPEKGSTYVVFPRNIREEFVKGRVQVHAPAGRTYKTAATSSGCSRSF